MKTIYIVRQIIVSIFVFFILCWAFFKNEWTSRLIMIPFLICSIALFFKNLFLLLHKVKLATIFMYLFRISLFTYIFGLLIYASYYAIIHQSYSLFIPIFYLF